MPQDAVPVRSKPPFRADHVGSFLRPKALLEAREARRTGTIDDAALRAVEDAAIRDIVRFQEDLGLRGITDGEFRRTYFHIDFLTQLEGVETKGGIQVKFHSNAGDVDFAPPVMQVTGKVRHVNDIQRADFEFLKSVTTRVPKVTIPSPTMLHFRGGRGGDHARSIPRPRGLLRRRRAGLPRRARRARGAPAAPTCSSTTPTSPTSATRRCARARVPRGDDPNELPRRYAALINAAIADRPAGMTVCIHLCRGNFKSAWAAEGGYEPVAEVLFNELAVDGYFLEYDDARSGDFAPLRFLPKGKTVVLGLVSTKLDRMETKDELKRRIDEAAKFVPLDQLCLSPQCGFSSTVHGNEIHVETQAAKIRLCVDVARDVWGTV